MGMYCQSCRTPLKLDPSLDDLNPASFDLLVGSAGKTLPDPASSSSRLNYPRERQELYEKAAAKNPAPIHKRTIPNPRHDRNAPSSPTARSRHGQKGNPDMSFIEITQSQIVPPVSVNHEQESFATERADRETSDGMGTGSASSSFQMERAQRLFAILSAHSDIDHPICSECTDLLLTSMESRLAASTRERDAYVSFLKSLQASSSAMSAEDAAIQERKLLESLEKEKAALEELKQLEEEKKTLDAEIAALEEQSQALEIEEKAFWASRNAFDERLHDLSTTLSSLQQKHRHDEQQLLRLQRTNVYNDTFCIGHDGYFGTINGLRLGRLPSQIVDWPEINAAWGQTLLLLATIAERLNFTFQNYRLRPMGSTSRIEKIEWPQQSPSVSRTSAARGQQSQRVTTQQVPTTATPKITPLDLFSSGDMPMAVVRGIWHRRFDNGMVAFLACLVQLGDFVERSSTSFTPAVAPDDQNPRPSPSRPPSSAKSRRTPTNRVLPYPIDGEMIGDPATKSAVSIRIGAGSDENWTKACKFALTCCKFLLAHVSNLANGSREAR